MICGAGIAGLAAAKQLAASGWECLVVEESPSLRDGGYLIDFFGPGFGAATAMGIVPRLRDLAFPISELTYVDRNGRRTAGLSYRRLGRALDGRLLSLLRGDLQRVIYDARGDVDVRFGCTVAAVQRSTGHVDVTLSDGSTHGADLLVGADGIHSRVRELVFGPEAQYLRPLGFHVAAYDLADAQLHRWLADRFLMTDTVDREVGVYGVRGDVVSVLAVHRTQDRAVPDHPRASVLDRFSDMGGIVATVLRQCPERPALYYDLVAQIRMRSWSRGRVVLLGDAGYAVSLLAGQGASLAVAGAFVLAEELAAAGDVRDALAGYESRLRPIIERKQVAGRRTADWFLPPNRIQLVLRRTALGLMRLPAINRLLVSALVGGDHDVTQSVARRSLI